MPLGCVSTQVYVYVTLFALSAVNTVQLEHVQTQVE